MEGGDYQVVAEGTGVLRLGKFIVHGLDSTARVGL